MNNKNLKKLPFVYSTSQNNYYYFTYKEDFKYSLSSKGAPSHIGTGKIEYGFCIYDYTDLKTPIDQLRAKKNNPFFSK